MISDSFRRMLPLAYVFFAACSVKSQSDAPTEKQELPVAQLVTKDTALQQAYVADIQALRNVEIRNRVTGFLDKVFVDEGQSVKKGQPLFLISNHEYKAAVARAKANLNSALAEAKTAELEVARIQLLVDKKVITAPELEMARSRHKALLAKADEARSALEDAQTQLSYTLIRAPFNGIINRIPLKVGSLLEEGTLLTSVSDVSAIYAYFNISEDEYLRYLKARQLNKNNSSNTVELILADNTTYHQTGLIETTASEFEESTGSIAFRAKFSNPDHLLKHGATGKVLLRTTVDDALMVPQKAVFEIQDKNYVYVVDRTNKVKMKSFVPQSRLSHFYIVESGLEPGEQVVYEGVQNIRDGMQIVPRTVALDSLVQATP